MLLAGKEPIVSDLQKELKARFDMVDLGLVQHLGFLDHNLGGMPWYPL